MYKITLQRDFFETCNKWPKWPDVPVDIIFHPQGVSLWPGAIYTCIKSWKKSYKIRLQRDFFKLVANDRSDKSFCWHQNFVPWGCLPLICGYIHLLYPWHLCWRVYSFRLSVCMFVRDSVPFVELLQSFMLKFLKLGISHQPLIRKHSYLDHRYPWGFAFIPWLLTPGSMSQGGARGKKLGHLKKVFFYFSVMETTYADSWSDMTQPCEMHLRVMKWRSV